MKVKLTYVNNEDKTSKAGKPYTACGIKTEQHGDQFINGFGNPQTKRWNVLDEVEIEVYEEEYQGKKSLKFKTKHPMDDFRERIEKLEAKVFGGEATEDKEVLNF